MRKQAAGANRRNGGPGSFLSSVIGLIASLGGTAFLSGYGPPADPPSIVYAVAYATAAISWLLGYLGARAATRGTKPALKIKRLAAAAAVLLAMLIVIGPIYFVRWNDFTIPCYGRRVWTGDQNHLTAKGQQYFRKHPSATKQHVAEADSCRVTEIWDYNGGIKPRIGLLWVLFGFFIAALVLAITFAAYAISAAQRM